MKDDGKKAYGWKARKSKNFPPFGSKEQQLRKERLVGPTA
jgi:hypothetical protein